MMNKKSRWKDRSKGLQSEMDVDADVDLPTGSRAARLSRRISNVSRLVALGYTSSTSDSVTAAHALIKRARLTQALAANARVLGVCDMALWGAVDVAWAVLLGAIGVCAGGLSPTAMGVAEPLLRGANARD